MMVAASAWAGAASAQSAVPQRVMSLNLCTDQLLLQLLPPERITSVTYLSGALGNAHHSAEAERVAVNHGLAEEVLSQHPDLVLTGTYSTPAARWLLKRVGIAVLEVRPANNFDEIRAVSREVARAVGAVAAGERLLAGMDRTLAALADDPPAQIIRVAGWDGGGAVPGKDTLFDAILTAAGGVNIATTAAGARSGTFSIEELLVARPDVLAYGSGSNSAPSRRTDAGQHPLIAQVYQHRRVSYPEVLYSCGLPGSADAAVQLRSILLAVMASPLGRMR